MKSKAKKSTDGLRLAGRFCKFPDGRIVYGPVWGTELAKAIDGAIAAAVRKAVKAERERCVEVIQTHREASLTGAVRHEAFVCDDLIAAIREAKP